MRAVAITVAAMLALSACASAHAPRAPQLPASLAISYYPHGTAGAVRHWRLTCRPAGGGHPNPRVACAELAAHTRDLAPRRRACPFFLRRGAPQARVTGRIAGRPLDRLVRPLCDDAAWHDLHVLLTGA